MSTPHPLRPRRISAIRVAQVAAGLALAAAMLIWGLPYFAKTSWSSIAEVLGTVPPGRAVAFLGLVLAGLLSYTFVLTGALHGLSHLRALVLNVCGSSVSNLLPGGGAVGLAATYSICRSWGFRSRDVSTMAIVTGVWNTLARVALPVIAITALVWGVDEDVPKVMRDAAIGGSLSGLAIVGVLVAVIASNRAAHAIGRGLDRVLAPLLRRRRRSMSVDALVTDLRARITDSVRRGWLPMTLGMVGFFGFYYVLFVAVMDTTGVTMPHGQLFAAYALGRLLTAVGVTPGGVGVTETGTAAALVAWGADPAAATAGVVLFSIYTHVMEVPLGALGWVAWSLMPKASAEELAEAAEGHEDLDAAPAAGGSGREMDTDPGQETSRRT
ncbi:lysylphosphatidylglycerol synthase domain-containing protein [Janibacter sp. G56]|uniref:lysylphosphatidylglycerol synthase domain-containing protein n=1 Tax=Janibacter sp. G56 TaxID=3418717 RepID=UPI003D07DD65